MDAEDQTLTRKQRLQELRNKRRKVETKDQSAEGNKAVTESLEERAEEPKAALEESAETREEKENVRDNAKDDAESSEKNERIESFAINSDTKSLSNFKNDISSLLGRAKSDTDSAIHRVLQTRQSS